MIYLILLIIIVIIFIKPNIETFSNKLSLFDINCSNFIKKGTKTLKTDLDREDIFGFKLTPLQMIERKRYLKKFPAPFKNCPIPLTVSQAGKIILANQFNYVIDTRKSKDRKKTYIKHSIHLDSLKSKTDRSKLESIKHLPINSYILVYSYNNNDAFISGQIIKQFGRFQFVFFLQGTVEELKKYIRNNYINNYSSCMKNFKHPILCSYNNPYFK